ncbi:unnamed protein product [Dicrocoelium dendriticum]|nr:unnamed protein product [Dicrocoelium dendriticum]
MSQSLAIPADLAANMMYTCEKSAVIDLKPRGILLGKVHYHHNDQGDFPSENADRMRSDQTAYRFSQVTFSSSLKLFFEDRTFTPDLLHLNHAFNTPIVDYYLLSELHLATTALTSMAYRLPSFSTGGFGISRLPGPYTGCVGCNSSENNFLLTYQWLLTLYVHREELDDYISFADDTSLFHPENIPKWIDAFNYSFEKSGVDMNCRGLLLALADMTLHNATHPYTTTGTTRFVRLLASWTLYTNRCLNRLYEFARFSSTFGIYRVVPNDEVATLSHLSLVITFAPAATEGVPGPSGLSS